ncbi:hypothetical protein GE107_10900 [Cohnella sp. CFH 77786]|uniref:S-layer homology domain-containing protein n=1 Tax=Cohnella sp. CFH 77786 TaxID=2662265 RepID=UPI001C6101F8|nr:S-layer homology domain-containing protein [Cohnella sp. CFH 77786]MBW5446567.1 hypothetical protein [Cohnella sp. CFH 77786]
MAKKTQLKKCVTAAALTALVWTGTVWIPGSASAAANPFGDVKAGHWAEKHVVKLALQGIIRGSEGQFRPNDSVRREDAVIIALKFMGLADDVGSAGSIAFPSTFQVDDYAKPYVMEAFKRKLLLTDEEFALANAETDKPWGKTPASREWVAKLLVRAIGLQAEAAANAGKATAFSDDAKMDASLRAYVLTAVQQGLVSGVTPTTFEPKQPITRAAIATLFSKAESKVNTAYSGQVSGVLLSVGADKLTVLHDDGSIRDYTLTAGTMFARYDTDKPSTLAGLKQYGKAILIHDADGSIGYVEQTDDKSYVTNVDGTFSKNNPIDAKIWLSVGNDFKSYSYDTTYKPAVTDAEGKTIQLSDIPEGTAVSLLVDTLRTEGKVVAVKVKQSVVNKKGSGVVTEWNPAAGTLKVSDAVTGTAETLNVSPTATFKQDDVFVGGDQLKVGYAVEYEVKAGVVVSVKFAKPVVTTVNGKLFSVDTSTRTIQYTDNGKLTAKFLADNAKVEIQGMTSAGLGDLQQNDDITLVLDGNDKVMKISVNNRSVQYLTGATIAGYISDTKTLSLKDASGKVYNFVLGSNVRYDLNDMPLTAADAQTRFTSGKKVTIAYSGDNAITIYFAAKYAGTVVENNTTAKTLSVRVGTNNTVTLPYTYPYVDAYGTTSASFADVKAGDQVTVLMNDNQDQITSIQLQKSVQLEVVSTDVTASKIRFKKPGTTTIEEWTVPATAVLQDENGTAVSLGQFTAGSVANVTFSGRFALLKIRRVTMTYGRVAAVNATAGTVDLALSNGSTVTKTVGFTPVVLKDTATYNTLAMVQPDDRVEVRQDENDRTVIEIVSPVKKLFWTYSSSSNSIQVRRSTLTENNVYNLDAQTYIHQGTTTLTPAQLQDGDPISIYILRGKVVEIAK